MATWKRGYKRRLVLDLGASAVRVCELAQTKTGYQLTKYYQAEFNSDPGLTDLERKKLRLKAVESVLKEAKVRTRKTIFAVPGQSVFTRSRTLPPVPEYKVTQIVRYEIQQQIPFSLDQIAMDYQILDRSEGGGYEVMMAAIKVDVVEKHLEILREARRSIDVVDVTPFAAYNWLKHTGEFGDSGECIALIDMGAATTDIIIERENQFRFTRPLNIGGNDVTMAVAAALGMNFSDAEKLKRQRAFAPTGDPKVDGQGGKVIGDVLQRMVNEIMRSFAYFRSLPGGGNVNRVILCGGGACLRNIVPYMQRQLGVDVRIAQPLAGLALAPMAQAASERPEQTCVALGLALRCSETVPIEINLIPPRVLEASRRREQALYWLMIFVTFALILASIIPISANQNEMVKARIRKVQNVLALYDPLFSDDVSRVAQQSPQVQDLNRANRAVQQPRDECLALNFAYRRCMFWTDAMKMLSEARPVAGDMWFTSFETVSKAQGQPGQPGQPAGQPAVRGERLGARRGLASTAGTGTTTGPGFFGFPGTQAPAEMRTGGVSGGAARGRGQPAQPQQPGGPYDYVIPPADGVQVTGYARNTDLIRQFVENLKKARIQLPTNWYLWVTDVVFDDRDVNKYPLAVLWDPQAKEVSPFADKDSIVYSFRVVVLLQMGREVPTQQPAAGGSPAPSTPTASAPTESTG